MKKKNSWDKIQLLLKFSGENIQEYRNIVKLMHTAVVEGTDPRHMVNRYFMAYRATPHRRMGKSLAELLFG